MSPEELNRLSDQEKLELISEIWNSLRNPDELPVPEEHIKILEERLGDRLKGNTKYISKDELEKLLELLFSKE